MFSSVVEMHFQELFAFGNKYHQRVIFSTVALESACFFYSRKHV